MNEPGYLGYFKGIPLESELNKLKKERYIGYMRTGIFETQVYSWFYNTVVQTCPI